MMIQVRENDHSEKNLIKDIKSIGCQKIPPSKKHRKNRPKVIKFQSYKKIAKNARMD